MNELKEWLKRKYNLEDAQIKSIQQSADELNDPGIHNTLPPGVIVVPFWLVEQLNNYKESVTDLMEQLERVTELQKLVDKPAIHVPEVGKPYIPGINGPRIGDEHLDTDGDFPKFSIPR